MCTFHQRATELDVPGHASHVHVSAGGGESVQHAPCSCKPARRESLGMLAKRLQAACLQAFEPAALPSCLTRCLCSGMGCSAGMIACGLAHRLLQHEPGKYALVVSTENITQNWYAHAFAAGAELQVLPV